MKNYKTTITINWDDYQLVSSVFPEYGVRAEIVTRLYSAIANQLRKANVYTYEDRINLLTIHLDLSPESEQSTFRWTQSARLLSDLDAALETLRANGQSGVEGVRKRTSSSKRKSAKPKEATRQGKARKKTEKEA